MKVVPVLLALYLQILGSYSFIVPDELPSILSVIYSNIPTIKKGTDSRLGWGFRLGDRADFQVLVELGPQTYTQPLGNQNSDSTRKRNTLNSLSNVLYAQRQQDKKHISDTAGGKWLDQWSKDVKESQENEALPVEPRPGLGIGEIDAKSVIPDDSMLKLKELLGKEQNVVEITTPKPKTTTSKEDALDNVDLDDK